MKILFVNNFFSPYGGAEKMMLNQAATLTQNGHEVVFFATDKKPYVCEPYDYEYFFPEYIDFKRLNKLDSLKHFSRIFYNREAEANLSELIKLTKPDVVHLHNIYYHLTPSIINACKKQGVPVVMTLHDPRLMCPGGTMMFRAKSYCHKEFCVKGNPLFGLIYRCRNLSLKESLVSTLEYYYNRKSKFYDYVSMFICPSKAVFNLAEKSGISGQRLVVLNNFIDNSLLNNPPVYSNKGYFLFIGRLAREKGLHSLIEAAKFLPKNIEFHIVGDGPEKQNLLNQTQNLGLPNIKFLGYLEGDALKEEISGCIATVLPCNWFEAFGLTIAESFAYGKPVIASRIAAIPELVSSNFDGLLFEAGSAEQLSQAVYKLYREKDIASVMGKKAREKAERMFNSDLYYKNLIKIYNSVLN